MHFYIPLATLLPKIYVHKNTQNPNKKVKNIELKFSKYKKLTSTKESAGGTVKSHIRDRCEK